MLTLIGALVLPLAVYWFIKLDTKKLLYLFAAVTPFSAATIVAFEGSNFGMPPSYFIALLLISTFIIRCILHKSKIRVDGVQKYYYVCFMFFWLYSLLTILLPVVFFLVGDGYSLFNPAFDDKNYAGDIPVYTVTQFIYFTFFLVTSFAVMNETKNLCIAKNAIKILLEVAMFTVIWGTAFYVLNLTGVVKYPQWIFNNHPGYYQGYNQKFAVISRMSSVAQEPSVYGYFLAIMISMVMTLNALDLYVLKPSTQKIFCFVMIAAAIMTTSTTAFIGILVSTIMTILLAMLYGKLRKAFHYLFKQLVVVLVIAMSFLFIVLNKIDFDIDSVIAAFYQLTILKAKTSSGNERYAAFYHGINVLSDTYYLGSGFGSNRNFDIGSTILANTGIIGLILFILSFGGVIAFSLLKVKIKIRLSIVLDDASKIAIGLVSALITALVLMFTSIPDFVNMYFWLILGLLMGMTKIISTNQQSKSSHLENLCMTTDSRKHMEELYDYN